MTGNQLNPWTVDRFNLALTQKDVDVENQKTTQSLSDSLRKYKYRGINGVILKVAVCYKANN